MIPRKIHWCWFSGEELPDTLNEIINYWKIFFPDFEIIKWDSDKYESIPNKPKYVIDAYSQKKWAFVADYVRAYAIYTEGGWYFDSDLQVLQPFLYKYEKYKCVSAIEAFGKHNKTHGGIQIQAAFLGAEKNHPYFKDIIDEYNNISFIFDHNNNNNILIAPVIYAKLLEKYGFVYNEKEQHLDEDIFIMSWKKILPHTSHIKRVKKDVDVNNIYAIHHCFHSWFDNPIKTKMSIVKTIKLLSNNLINKK